LIKFNNLSWEINKKTVQNQTDRISKVRAIFLEQIIKGLSTFKLNLCKKGDKKMREAKFVKSLTVALSVDAYQKIKEITDDEKISMAQWVRRAVNLALEGDALDEE